MYRWLGYLTMYYDTFAHLDWNDNFKISNKLQHDIKKGLNVILSDFKERYNLLEKTHKQIMRLPSVRNHLNKSPYNIDSDSDSDDEHVKSNNNDLFVKFSNAFAHGELSEFIIES